MNKTKTRPKTEYTPASPIERYLYSGCKTVLLVTASLADKELVTKAEILVPGGLEQRLQDKIWASINKDNRIYGENTHFNYMTDYFNKYVYNDLKKSTEKTKRYELPIGEIFFFEHMIEDADGSGYIIEPFQIIWLLSPSRKKVGTATRRASKTTISAQIQPLYDAIFKPGYGTIVIEQGRETADTLLIEPLQWIDNNPLLLKFAGGKGFTWNKHHITFKNGGYLKVGVGSSTTKLRGTKPTPKRVLRDEFAFHEHGESEVSIIRLGNKKSGAGEEEDNVISTPNGPQNPFTEIQRNTTYENFFLPLYCPKGRHQWLCDDTCPWYSWYEWWKDNDKRPVPACNSPIKYRENENGDLEPDFEGVFWRIDKNRLDEADVLGEYSNIGRERFEQEFMLRPLTMEGGIYSKEFLDNHFFDDNIGPLDEYYDDPCYVGLDFGLTEKHRSVITIVAKKMEGEKPYARILRVYAFPSGTDYNEITSYVNNHIMQHYNVEQITADANAPTKHLVEHVWAKELNAMGFTNLLAYKTEARDTKDGSMVSKSGLYMMIKAKMELDQIKCYNDRELQAEMLAIKAEQTSLGNLTFKSHMADDRWMSIHYAMFPIFNRSPRVKLYTFDGPSLGERYT